MISQAQAILQTSAMFSSNTSRFVLALAAACDAVTSVTAADEVNIGSAENCVILTKTGISTAPDSFITGDIGVSPIAATAMTGFDLITDSGGEHAPSSQLHGTGLAFAADHTAPIGTQLTAAVSAMETTHTNAKGRDNTDGAMINLGAGTLGGINPQIEAWCLYLWHRRPNRSRRPLRGHRPVTPTTSSSFR
jgi:hypothetical protein